LTLAALNCLPEIQPTCRPLIRKAYFPEKSAANTPVFVAVVIHMNGRIYDPTLGRMLQADPFIQFPTNTQSYNRYSYVLNNPFAYTDPSGYFSFKDLIKVAAVVAISVATYNLASAWAMSVAMNSSYFMGTYGLSGASIAAGVAGGAAGGFAGGVSMAAFSGANFNEAITAGGRGALVGGVSGGAMAWADAAGTATGRTIGRALVGGTVSEATGGKFANGAVTAAFVSILAEGAAAHYRENVGGNPTMEPGENIDGKPVYEIDPLTGKQRVEDRVMNVFGPNRTGKVCSQGSRCSRFFNEVPGFNSLIARPHDRLFNGPNAIPFNLFTNVSTMLPTAAYGYTAYLGQHQAALSTLQALYLSVPESIDRDGYRRDDYSDAAIGGR